ncbi:MAG: PAS domain S-box protein [Candidatus Thorarchaeota archaeon]
MQGQQNKNATNVEDEYFGMMMLANDGIIILQDDRIIMANPAFLEMMEYDFASLEGKPITDLLEPTTAHQFTEVQEGFNWGQSGRPAFRARFLKKNGDVIHVEISTSDFALSRKPAIMGIVRNVTRQVELEAAIDASESRYRALFDSSPIAYFSLSLMGNVLQVNKAATRLLGYKEEDLLRRNFSSFLPNGTAKEIVGQMISEAANGKSVEDFEMQMKTADGRSNWVSVTANLLEYPDQSSTIALMALDIDRRKNAEAREQTERDRANLYLEVMTHDLNNVNQSLLFSTGLLQNSEDIPEQYRPLLHESSWNVRRAARMVANLRSLFRLANDPPTRTKVDIYDYFQSSLERVKADFPWKTLSLTTNIEKGKFDVAGHQYLEQVFFNIIHNSMTFDEHDNVVVEVKAEVADEVKMLRIEFIDQGPGVPDSAKEFIFRRTGSPDEQIVGRGLGLTLVDRIVKNIGGKIRVEDRVNGVHSQGARFILLLPLWIEAPELHCGRNTCITFFKSNHCVFCDPAMEILTAVLDSMGVPRSMVETINVDDPDVDVNTEELPMLPYIKICERELTGFISEGAIRSSVLNLLMTNCYPDFV